MSEKACKLCPEERIKLGVSYGAVPKWRRVIGVCFIYLPVFLSPFAIVMALLARTSLIMLGAKDLKRYRDFVPESTSHRYNYSNQIVRDPENGFMHLRWRAFWIFNCTFYCPLSVALFDYLSYLVKAVENWWCPFHHSRKDEYATSAIDKSYWHVCPGEVDKLAKDDRDNPIWNDESPLVQIKKQES